MKKILAFAFFLTPLSALADLITVTVDSPNYFDYNNTGQDVTHVSASFTFDADTSIFVANTSLNVSALLTEWSITDGVSTITQADSNYALVGALVWFDDLLEIVGADIFVDWAAYPTPVPTDTPYRIRIRSVPDYVNGADIAETYYCYDYEGSTCLGGVAQVTDRLQPAEFTVTATKINAVPEPTTLSLFGVGLLGIALFRRKRA